MTISKFTNQNGSKLVCHTVLTLTTVCSITLDILLSIQDQVPRDFNKDNIDEFSGTRVM